MSKLLQIVRRLRDIPADKNQMTLRDIEVFLRVCELREGDQVIPSRLADDAKMDKAGVSRSVERLVELGYVRRKIAKNDRRCITVMPSSKGIKLFGDLEYLANSVDGDEPALAADDADVSDL